VPEVFQGGKAGGGGVKCYGDWE